MFGANTTLGKIHRSAVSFEWSNTIGLGRTFLGAALLFTLLFNDIEQLIYPMGKGEFSPIFTGSPILKELNLFRLLDFDLYLAEAFSILVLVLVVIGWRPRITCIFHWWVAYSYATSAMVLDGGDQIGQVLTLLLIPICLMDSRKWHWQKMIPSSDTWQKVKGIIAWSTLLIIQLQVAFIYFHAFVGKLNVMEWVNGTIIFYWIQNPTFGLGEELGQLLIPLIAKGSVVTFLTWGTLLLELLLFMALIMNRKQKRVLMILGILFHFGIIIFFGLVSFFCAMVAALIFYLGPPKGFSWINRIQQQQIFKPIFSRLSSRFSIPQAH